MEFTSLIGLVSGIGLIIFGMLQGGDLMNFYDIGSIYITFGGTIAATVASFPISRFKYIPKHMKIVFGKKKYKPEKYIDTIVEFAQEARKKGILTLEDKAMEQKDSFLSKSVMLVVDAIDPAKTKEILENELNCLDQRHAEGWAIYEKASTYAPAFGMIGTLIGLVNMLAGLDMNAQDGTQKLTGGMATALITTFYGTMFANCLLVPIASKLRSRHDEEMLCKEIITEGVLAIQRGDNPRDIDERLRSYLIECTRSKTKPNKETGKKAS